MNYANKMKRKYRFNIIDVLLLAVIILSVCSIVFLVLYDGGEIVGDNGSDSVELVYTVEQKELLGVLRGKISIGDSVIDTVTAQRIGQVIDVEYIDSTYTEYDPESDSTYEAVYPNKIDMRVRISVSAKVDKNGVYAVGDCPINVGRELEVRFPYYTGKVVCISVSEVSE